MPFTYRRLPALSAHAREFDFPHAPRDGVHYVGPLVLERRIEPRVTDDVEGRLALVFDQRRDPRGARKLVYAGFGSFFSTTDTLVRRLIDAVAERSLWDLVISLGNRATPADLGRLPPNVHAFGWVPQMQVLRNADVAVVHGGASTVAECIICGVPMLVYCGFETDMGGNAARVLHHQLGVVGDPRADGPREMREHLDRVLREPRFADNVTRMGGSYAAYADHRVAERVVESLLGS